MRMDIFCVWCKGTGKVCWDCSEAEPQCECGDGPSMVDCSDCLWLRVQATPAEFRAVAESQVTSNESAKDA